MQPLPDDVNCDLDEESDAPRTLRPSEAMIAAALMLPAAISVGREVLRSVREMRRGRSEPPGEAA